MIPRTTCNLKQHKCIQNFISYLIKFDIIFFFTGTCNKYMYCQPALIQDDFILQLEGEELQPSMFIFFSKYRG